MNKNSKSKSKSKLYYAMSETEWKRDWEDMSLEQREALRSANQLLKKHGRGKLKKSKSKRRKKR